MQEIYGNKIKIISFHTTDEFYTSMAKKLEASCNKFKLEYEIEAVEPKGSWV